jgi:hypothetical protein
MPQITHLFLCTLLLIGFRSHAQSDSSYIVRFTDPLNHSGYVDQQGRTVVRAGKYAVCLTDTVRTYAIVQKNEGDFVAIDRSGVELYTIFAERKSPDTPSEGTFRIVRDGKMGFADAVTGEIVVAPVYAYVKPYNWGIAQTCDSCRWVVDENYSYLNKRKGRWSYIDKAGNKIVTNKGKKYPREVIDKHVTELNAALKAGNLRNVAYPQKSSCGGDLHGFYEGSKLQYIEARDGGENGYVKTQVWFKDSSVVKVIITRHFVDEEANWRAYPGQKPDKEKLIYYDDITTVYVTPGKILLTRTGAKPEPEDELSPERRFEKTTIECIESMMIELLSSPPL